MAGVVDGPDEEALVMRSSLGSLSDETREILMLAGWDGLTAAQIGQVLGCSATAARIRLHRARAQLRDAWDELDPGPKHARVRGHERRVEDENRETLEEAHEV